MREKPRARLRVLLRARPNAIGHSRPVEHRRLWICCREGAERPDRLRSGRAGLVAGIQRAPSPRLPCFSDRLTRGDRQALEGRRRDWGRLGPVIEAEEVGEERGVLIHFNFFLNSFDSLHSTCRFKQRMDKTLSMECISPSFPRNPPPPSIEKKKKKKNRTETPPQNNKKKRMIRRS